MMECSNCHTKGNFRKDVNGFLICVVCSTESQDFAPELLEFDDHSNLTLKRKRKIEVNESSVAYFEAFQLVLMAQVEAVIAKLSYPEPSALVETVEELWFNYLVKFWGGARPALDAWDFPGADGEGEGARGQEDPAESDSVLMPEGEGQLRKHYPKGFRKGLPTLGVSVCFVYLAMRRLRIGVLSVDVEEWIRVGALPYLAVEGFPEAARKWLNLSPLLSTPSSKYICKNTSILAEYLEVKVPPLNYHVVFKNLATRMDLPEEFEWYPLQLMSSYPVSKRKMKKSVPQTDETNTDSMTTEYIHLMAYVVIAIKYYYCYSEKTELEIQKQQGRVKKQGGKTPPILEWLGRVTEKIIKNKDIGCDWKLGNILSLSATDQQKYFEYLEKFIFKKSELEKDKSWLAQFFEDLGKSVSTKHPYPQPTTSPASTTPLPTATTQRNTHAAHYIHYNRESDVSSLYRHLLLVCASFCGVSALQLGNSVIVIEKKMKKHSKTNTNLKRSKTL